MLKINKVQELNLKLISTIKFNNFNGEFIAVRLRKIRKLWKGVIADRKYTPPILERGYNVSSGCDLIKLRDIETDFWNVDTIFILSSGINDNNLIAEVSRWHPDSIEWIEGKRADQLLGSYPSKEKILELWWD